MLFIILRRPSSLTGASFQMSFAAVIALIAAWEMGAGWRRRLHERAELSNHRWLWRLGVGIAASLATSLIASIATGAFAAYHFNRLSILGVVANMLGVPLTGFWIMPWGLLAMLLMPLGLERFALVPMGWGIDGLNAIARHVAEWPQAAMLVPSLPGASLWLLTVGGLWLCLWRRRWRLAGLPVAITGTAAGAAAHARPADERGRPRARPARFARHGAHRFGPHRPLHQRRLGATERAGGRQALDRERRRAGCRPRLRHRALPLAQGSSAFVSSRSTRG